MTETFAATMDALEHALLRTVGVAVDTIPRPNRPWYLPAVPPQTPAQYGAAIAKLGKLGIVKVN